MSASTACCLVTGLKCQFEESVTYDALGNELERKLSIIEVLAIITPPVQRPLI